MEEARQHPTLTAEQWGFAVIWFAGPLALIVGILLALGIGQPAIVVAIVIQAISRVIAAGWSAVRPEAQITRSPLWWRIVAALLWLALALSLVSAELN